MGDTADERDKTLAIQVKQEYRGLVTLPKEGNQETGNNAEKIRLVTLLKGDD